MAQVKTVARKYAKGLYEACAPAELLQVRDVLSTLAKVVAEHPAVLAAIKNPAISETDKTAVLLAILERNTSADLGANAAKFVPNLMRVLVENKRASAIAEVASSFEEIVAHHFKMSQIHISSARPMEADERGGYENQLRQQLGPQTEVTFSVDPELLGGMQVKAGDTLIDGSVRTSLQQLRAALLN